MSSQITAAYAMELLSQITQDNDGIVEPLMKLVAGITDSRGDPLRVAIRGEILSSLYSKTKDCQSHCRAFIGDDYDLNQSSSSIS